MSAHEVYNGLKVTRAWPETKSAGDIIYRLERLLDDLRDATFNASSDTREEREARIDQFSYQSDALLAEMQSLSKQECIEVADALNAARGTTSKPDAIRAVEQLLYDVRRAYARTPRGGV